jgi:hypothetical protein
MMTGAFDQTTAAAFRLTPALGKVSDRIEFASRDPSPAPTICPRQASFRPVPASRIAAVTARSPAAISAAIIATRSGRMSSLSFIRASRRGLACLRHRAHHMLGYGRPRREP